MLPQPRSWSEPRDEDSNPLAQPDLVSALEGQIAAGFPPGLALDLVLNELVVRAATATRAHAAALALKRDSEMVCRAATGEHAPDLGIPLNTKDGLSGACLRTHQSQLCLDTESDARVDAPASRRLGIRSMLIVPVMDRDEMVGVLEVFGTAPAEFVESDQNLLEIFAREVTRIRRASFDLERDATPAAFPRSPSFATRERSRTDARGPFEIWTLVLGGLAIILAVAISFVIGSRIGWLGRGAHSSQNQNSVPTPPATTPAVAQVTRAPVPAPPSPKPANAPVSDGLVISQQGRVVFRMRPSAQKAFGASSATGAPRPSREISRIWLAPDLAETRLRHRNEPLYPPDARAAHRTGEVLLEVVVSSEGAIAETKLVSGDPVLAAAALDAVRTWRYEPYRVQGRPAEFQTDVTLKFSLPE
jgi:TonB family protein